MSKTVNGVRYVIDLVPENKWGIKCPYPMNAKKVTLHNTDNDMPASNEASYHNRNNNQTSFHLVFDEKEGRQLLRFDRNGWHSGDGLNGYGNRNTIAAEIARNYDRTRRTTNLLEPLQGYYTRAEQNAIKVLAQVMIDEGIVANNANIKTHNDWSGKWCPSKILNEGRLQQVKNGIIAEYNRLKGIETKPVKPTSPKKEDGHLSFSQVVDKTIAGGYGSQPQREKNINNKTNFTYKRVQDGANAKLKAVVKPKPVAPKTGIERKYKESGTFYMNDTIIVRDQPSTNGKIIARYYKGENVKYHTVHLGNGYVWLQYDRKRNGRTFAQGYIPCRTYNNGKYGTLWGTIK